MTATDLDSRPASPDAGGRSRLAASAGQAQPADGISPEKMRSTAAHFPVPWPRPGTSCCSPAPDPEPVPRRVAIRAYGDGTRHAYDAARLARIKIDLTIRPICHLRGGDPELHYFDRINGVPQTSLADRGCPWCAAVLATVCHEVIVGVDVVRIAGRLPVDVPQESEPAPLSLAADTARPSPVPDVPHEKTLPPERTVPESRDTRPPEAAHVQRREPALSGAPP
ncbi:hypothetical protein [Amycolatopsis rubida]|uniref:Uncharacterized protein n=1 Tax=Amycolatopsis rubida TaxID=112413 RepID=A0A1I5X6Q3_9PSEU|nr:hypothetical protein [Amycolatopsis rubida]SFQ27669.1 hypothetical protein SAMN05421854_11065 [Amycolatopsis rubida]